MMKVINTEHVRRDIVVIGASAGGVEALINLFKSLGSPLSGAVAVVLHRHPMNNVCLRRVLGRATRLPVIEASGEGPFRSGTIYLAPGDAHLVLTEQGLHADRGPKEHSSRPAVDPLFRSAAAVYGPRVIGVLLTGAGDDGGQGLTQIKGRGGVSVVQDPAEAQMPSMPMNALRYGHVDLTLPLADIASTLQSLMRGEEVSGPRPSAHSSQGIVSGEISGGGASGRLHSRVSAHMPPRRSASPDQRKATRKP